MRESRRKGRRHRAAAGGARYFPAVTAAPRRLPVWLLVSAAWVVPATLAGAREYLQYRMGGNEDALRSAVFEFGDWLLCGVLTPVIFVLARKFPLTRGRLAGRIALHFLFAVVFCASWAGLGILYGSALHGQPWTPWDMGAAGWFINTIPYGVAIYFSMLGVAHGVAFFLESRERETQAALLSAQLADARLAALRMQLQPHFLFNSLNALGVILRDRDTATASRMLEQLGAMLRRVMRPDRPQEVTLAEEVDFIRQYLAIEELRFSDRLRPVIDVDDALLRSAVPEFILQPLVENAIRHGLSKRTEATLVRIAARHEGDALVLTVTDDGPGPSGAESGAGVGLRNTRERLATLYGQRARLTLAAAAGGGTVAEVRLPWRELERG